MFSFSISFFFFVFSFLRNDRSVYRGYVFSLMEVPALKDPDLSSAILHAMRR